MELKDKMICPVCGYDGSAVFKTNRYDEMTRRRRKCLKCNFRYNTHELIVKENKFRINYKYAKDK